MLKKILFLLFIALYISCSKDNSENNQPEPNQNEDVLPVISISELENLIETKSSFNITISGTEAQTNTTVLINDIEVASTDQKDFELEINPFDYPNGKTSLKVKSVTAGNLESVKDEEIEINKLLFRSFGGLSSESVDSYLAINLQSTGELVGFKKIITYDDPIFLHAEDNFIEENIIVTQYIISNNSSFQMARMFGNVKPGTELISIEEVANQLGIDVVWPSNQTAFNVTIEGTSNSGFISLLGRDYNFGNSSFPTLEIMYDEALTENVFLYYYNQYDNNILNNYRYSFIDNLEDQSIQFEEMTMLQEEDITTFQIPNTVDSASITLFGFNNEESYRENLYRLLFVNSIQTGTSGYTASYPYIKEYPIVVKSIGLDFLDGSNLILDQKNTLDITIPDITVQKNEGDIEINGAHDFSELNLEVLHPDPAKNDIFRMSYKNLGLDTIDIPFDTFEIPEEIVQILNERGFGITTTNHTGELNIQITNYDDKLFPNGVFHYSLGRENGDAFYWTIPLDN